MKVYELKKGMQIEVDGEVIEFEEIRGEVAVFYTQYGNEIKYPNFIDIEEIGALISADISSYSTKEAPTLF